ncbi:MAG: hypothetical protein LBL83_11930 [Clostridiales bacterium]|jgi:hypothetical protein|nr:hypothetical protein [Clostridiales bacterium]
MPNIFQRFNQWRKEQVAEYRYQRAVGEQGAFAQGLIEKQQAELARINGNRGIPDEHKNAAMLEARERLYSDSVMDQWQERIGKVNSCGDALDQITGDDIRRAKPKGRGIGAFFGRLAGGRGSDGAFRRKEEARQAFERGVGLGLNADEQRALDAYRGVRTPPKELEAVEVARIRDVRRPARYQGAKAAIGAIHDPNLQRANLSGPEQVPFELGNLYQNGSPQMSGANDQPLSVKTNGLVQGNTPADTGYRLGWAGYAFFDKGPGGLFRGVRAVSLPAAENSATGKIVIGAAVEDADMVGEAFGQISTNSVSSCSAVIIRKGNKYAMLHLDASHTVPGEPREHLMAAIQERFCDGEPGEIEIMESVMGQSGSEVNFCNDMEDMLRDGGNTLKRQRIDRSAGRAHTGDKREPGRDFSGNNTSGHLEIGLTSQDVVFGDRAELNENGELYTRPVEWRLGAPQANAEAVWNEQHGYRQFTTVDAATRRADDTAERRVERAREVFQGHVPGGTPAAVPYEPTLGLAEAAAIDALVTRVAAAAEAGAREARGRLDAILKVTDAVWDERSEARAAELQRMREAAFGPRTPAQAAPAEQAQAPAQAHGINDTILDITDAPFARPGEPSANELPRVVPGSPEAQPAPEEMPPDLGFQDSANELPRVVPGSPEAQQDLDQPEQFYASRDWRTRDRAGAAHSAQAQAPAQAAPAPAEPAAAPAPAQAQAAPAPVAQGAAQPASAPAQTQVAPGAARQRITLEEVGARAQTAAQTGRQDARPQGPAQAQEAPAARSQRITLGELGAEAGQRQPAPARGPQAPAPTPAKAPQRVAASTQRRK